LDFWGFSFPFLSFPCLFPDFGNISLAAIAAAKEEDDEEAEDEDEESKQRGKNGRKLSRERKVPGRNPPNIHPGDFRI
jgi:hypothetical protein